MRSCCDPLSATVGRTYLVLLVVVPRTETLSDAVLVVEAREEEYGGGGSFSFEGLWVFIILEANLRRDIVLLMRFTASGAETVNTQHAGCGEY